MRRIAIVAALLAVAVMPGVAPAAPAEPSRVADPALDRLKAADELATALSAGDDPAGALGRVRQRQFGANASGLNLLGRGPIERDVKPAGDMDGDGIGDVIVAELENASTPLAWGDRRASVSGLRGADGTPMWRWDGPGEIAFTFPAPHLGPDSRPGAFVLARNVPGVWRVVALDATGDERWVRTLAPESGIVVQAGYVDYMFPLIVLEDGTGDGVSDVIAQRWVLVYTGLDVRINIVATVLDGVDGSIRSVFTTTARNSTPGLVAAGDLDGDGATDVISASADELSYRIAARRIDGSDIWAAPAAGGRYAFLEPGPDSDGDGAGDIVVWFPSLFDDAPADTVVMIGGEDGAVWWMSPGDFPRATHDVDGDALTDVRMMRVIGPDFFSPNALSFAARRGTDGTVVYDQSVPIAAAPHRALGLVGDADDADGDGIGDWVFDVRRYDQDWNELTPEHRAVSGADGSTLWLGRPGIPLYGDVDGDGGADQIRGQTEGDRTLRLDLLRGPDGSASWSRRFHLTSDAYLLVVYPQAYDLTGDGVAEVVLTVYTVGPSAPLRGAIFSDVVSQIFVVDGATGVQRWAVG